MAAHLRLASLDGVAVLPPPVAAPAAGSRGGKGRPRAAPGADHSTFKAMVRTLHDTGLDSLLRGLLSSVAAVEEEKRRRAAPPPVGRAPRKAGASLATVAAPAPGRGPATRTTRSGTAGSVPGTTGPATGVGWDAAAAARKRAARAIVAADADPRPGERLLSEAGTPLAYQYRGVSWTMGRADAERRGVPHLGGRTVCYAWARPLGRDAAEGDASA